MSRLRHIFAATTAAAVAASALASAASRAGAQPAPARAARTAAWNDSATLALVRRAEEVRRAQLADSALRSYRAVARGTLAFLGQVGDLLVGPPRVVQAAQVVTEVYWRAPNVSRQVVVGTRDTSLLPTDNEFYRDRYGIVQNNFPDVIRLGAGRDVADVPHPLSPAGPALYDFAARDTLGIRLGAGRTVRVAEVQVRPRDPSAPRFVGSLYLDLETARLVRMAFTFTRSAYLDRRNEDVSVVLENALVEGRFWLPRRQEVEVRRAGTFLEFPARGIIRGRWDVGEYEVNAGLADTVFRGPALAFAPPEARRRYPFPGRVVDALPPDVQFATQDDVARVRAQARALVQARSLTRARTASVSARAASDFARVTRAEGLALGGGVALRPAPGVRLGLAGRYGLADEEPKGRAALAWARPNGAGLRLEAARDYAEAGDAAEVSRVRNSVAAQEFGSDWTDPFDVRSAALVADLPVRAEGVLAGVRASLGVSAESHGAVAVRARPFAGAYEPTLAADRLRLTRLTVGAERPAGVAPLGATLQLGARLSAARTDLGCERSAGGGGVADALGLGGGSCAAFARGAVTARAERPFGDRRLVLHTVAAGAAGRVPVQELAFFGGPVTGPGYDFHALAGRAGVSQRVEWQFPVPFPSLPLGRYGRSPAAATLAPYAHLAAVWRPEAVRAGLPAARAGAYPALGVGALSFFDLVRVDVARGVGRGGRWLFSVDVAREFWRVL